MDAVSNVQIEVDEPGIALELAPAYGGVQVTTEDNVVLLVEASRLSTAVFTENPSSVLLATETVQAPVQLLVEPSPSLYVEVPVVSTPAVTEVIVQGQQGVPGPTGTQGPQGTPGTGVMAMTVSFDTPSLVWEVEHSYPYRPDVETYDQVGDKIYGEESHPTSTLVRVTHGIPMAGKIRLL